MSFPISREQAADMADAHAEGEHAELPREGCPECEDRPLRTYPSAADLSRVQRQELQRDHDDLREIERDEPRG